MKGRFSVIAAAFFFLATAGEIFAEGSGATPWREITYDPGQVGEQACTDPALWQQNSAFQKEGNQAWIPGIVSVGLAEWEAVYIPIDVETNWFKSTRSTHKPVLVQMTATPCTYLPFSDNDEFVALMEDVDARRDFIYGLEKARGREVEAVEKVKYDGWDYIVTRYKSDSGEKVLFSLGSIARNGLMVAFTFCFDRADEAAVTDLNATSIISTFLENVNFGSRLHFGF